MRDLEARAGVRSLDDLLTAREGIMARLARLRSLYGPGGVADHLRKVEICKLKSLIRLQALKDGRKVTESQIDDEGHAHHEYQAILQHMAAERQEWAKLEEDMESLQFELNRGQALIKFAAAELHLTPGGA
jgi:hypothetical protein